MNDINPVIIILSKKNATVAAIDKPVSIPRLGIKNIKLKIKYCI
nr:hypothetical protein [Rickettsia prowazekii]